MQHSSVTDGAVEMFGTSLLIVSLLLVARSPAPLAQSAGTPPQCQPITPLTKISELREASGIAPSRQSPGRLYALNDSGQPILVVLNDKGAVIGRLTLAGAKVDDWEALATGPCPAGSCIFVGDIGDNATARRTITVYRSAEPAETTGFVNVTDVFHATYPDGRHDAETLLVSPNGALYIVTKGNTGPVALYQFPRELTSGATVTLQRVGKPRDAGKPAANERITDGAVSPSGTWVALRTAHSVALHRTDELLAGNWRAATRVALDTLGEPQGEGVTFADEHTMYVVGEGGGGSQPGTFGLSPAHADS
jgi:hypothetical protein